MKSFARRVLVMALALVLGASPLATVHAQNEVDPAVVVSITNPDELMSDINYLTTAANAQQVGGMIALMGGGFLQLMDRTKPAGVYITLDQGEPVGIAFLPVKDLNMALTQLQAMIGPAQDVGDGVKQVGRPGQTAFVKAVGPWVFLSDKAENLSVLPQDPSAVLGDLPEQYDLAVQINVRNIPEQFRQMAVEALRSGFQQQFDNSSADADEKELAEKLSGNSMQQLVTLIEQSDQVTIGWEADSEQKVTYLDMSVTAIEGSELAQQMEILKGSSTNFAGFVREDAAASLNFNSKIPEQDIEQSKLVLQAVRDKAMTELENDPDLPDAQSRQAAKDIVNKLLDVLAKTIESGKLDGGAVVVMDPEAVRVVMGGYIADGAALEDALRQLVQLAQNEPDFPEVQFDAESHGAARFHKLSVPIPADEEDAQRLFGEQLDVIVAVADQSFYLAFGKDNAALLKEVIDQSAAGAQEVPPMALKVNLAPILQVAASMNESDQKLQAVSAAAQQQTDDDQITFHAEGIDRGIRYRLLVQEGVLQILGQVAQQQQAGAGQR